MNELLDVKVERMTKLDGGSKVKAFCDLVFGDLFLIRGFRVVEGDKGLFVGMPQQAGKQGKWFNVFIPSTDEIKNYLGEIVLQAYAGEAE